MLRTSRTLSIGVFPLETCCLDILFHCSSVVVGFGCRNKDQQVWEVPPSPGGMALSKVKRHHNVGKIVDLFVFPDE